MSRDTCGRCGAEESIFWYPYAFGMAPIPSVVDRTIDRAQYFTLCDECQREFVDFMHNAKRDAPEDADIDVEKIKELINGTTVIVPTAEEYK